MTPSELRQWAFENSKPDQWWLSFDSVVLEIPVSGDEIEKQLKNGKGPTAKVLHISQTDMENPPWVDVSLLKAPTWWPSLAQFSPAVPSSDPSPEKPPRIIYSQVGMKSYFVGGLIAASVILCIAMGLTSNADGQKTEVRPSAQKSQQEPPKEPIETPKPQQGLEQQPMAKAPENPPSLTKATDKTPEKIAPKAQPKMPVAAPAKKAPKDFIGMKIAEIKTLDGKIYTKARITNVAPDSISIVHESGAGKILLKNLPADFQTAFGYDSEKAASYSKAQAKAQTQMAEAQAAAENKKAETEALLKSAKPGIFVVKREIKEGLLVRAVSPFGLTSMQERIGLIKRIGRQKTEIDKVFTTGKAKRECIWDDEISSNYCVLIGLPKNEEYIADSVAAGLFVKAGSVKLSDDSRVTAFRFVGLAKSENISEDDLITEN